MERLGLIACSARRGVVQSKQKTTRRAYESTSTKRISKRPVPTAEQQEKLKGLSKDLVRVAVVRNHKQAIQASSSEFVEERRKQEDIDFKELSRQFRPPTREKLEFDASEVDDVVEEEIPAPPIKSKKYIGAGLQPGSFIELRRNFVTMHGVILREKNQDGSFGFQSLSSTGEIWLHKPGDVMISFPSLIPTHIIDNIGEASAVDGPEDIAARLAVIKRLRRFEHSLSNMENHYISVLTNLYDQVCASQPTEWSQISLETVLEMYPPPSPDDMKIARVAVHKVLMEDHVHFVANNHHRVSLSFNVRPRAEVQNIERIISWIRNDSAELKSFVEKAKEISTRRAESTGITKPHLLSTPLPTFSQSDRHIIDFLRCSVRRQSTHQLGPYSGFGPTIVKKVGLYKEDITSDVIFNFLKRIGEYTPWEDFVVHFEERSLAEAGFHSIVAPADAAGLLTEDSHASIRHDWGNLAVYVIDSETADELDDGISIEAAKDGTTWIHVHIADPTVYLPQSHPISALAYRRSTSLYGPQRTFTMLPTGFSFSKSSLGAMVGNTNPSQNVLTFSARLDAQGEIVESVVRAGVVKNVKVITYADVETSWGFDKQRYLPFGTASVGHYQPKLLPAEMLSDLDKIREVSSQLEDQKAKNGRFSWGFDKAKIIFENKGDYPLTVKNPPELWSGYPEMTYEVESGNLSPARRMVAEAMILAGRVAGKFCTERDLPALYRSARQPLGMGNLKTEEQGEKLELETAVKAGIAGLKATYSVSPASHWALGITSESGGYVRVTSPLRRFSDMVMHWQIKAALLQEKPAINYEDMEIRSRQLMQREMTNSEIEKAAQRYWPAVFIQNWLRNHPSDDKLQDLTGMIISDPFLETFSRKKVVGMYLPTLGVTSYAPASGAQGLARGDKLQVRVSGVEMFGKPKIRVEHIM